MEKSLNILILEDRESDLALTKRAVLKKMPNVSFTWAKSGEEFREKLHWMTYDVVLADYHLPGYNGLEALLYVRENSSYLPFIFVTGTLQSEEKAAAAIVKGANGFVSKENLMALPDHIVTVLEADEDRRSVLLEEERKKRERGIALQKAIHLLRQEKEMTNQSEILDLLRQVSETYQHVYNGGVPS